MAVSMIMAQPASMVADDAVGNPMSCQPGVKQNGLFGSILAGLPDSGNPAKNVISAENALDKMESKSGADVKDTDNEGLEALMSQQLASMNGIPVAGNSPIGLMKGAANRLDQAILHISTGGEPSFSASQLEEIRSAAGELEQGLKELAEQLKPELSKQANQGKAGIGEKSLKRMSDKFDELTNLINAAVNPVNGKTEPDPGKMEISGAGGGGSGGNENVSQIMSSLQSTVGQCKDLIRQNQIDRILAPSDKPLEKQSLASADMKNPVDDNPAATGKETGKLFGIKMSDYTKNAGRSNSLSVPAEGKVSGPTANTEGVAPAGNNEAFPKVEISSGDSSSHGGFMKENGDAFRNLADAGKGNLNTTSVNTGIRSFEITVQMDGQSRDAVAELSRPVSHEQIITQIREKLAATPVDGDISRITLKLHPEELGELRVSMKMENQSLKVDIITDSRNVRDALMNNMDSLKETLSRQNISMERFNVLAGGGFGNGDNYREWRQSAQNNLPNPLRQHYGFADEASEKTAAYLDASDNSLIDLRL